MVERDGRHSAESELVWRKSSASGQESCFEVAISGPDVLVRDSKNRSGAKLTFPQDSWKELLGTISSRPRRSRVAGTWRAATERTPPR